MIVLQQGTLWSVGTLVFGARAAVMLASTVFGSAPLRAAVTLAGSKIGKTLLTMAIQGVSHRAEIKAIPVEGLFEGISNLVLEHLSGGAEENREHEAGSPPPRRLKTSNQRPARRPYANSGRTRLDRHVRTRNTQAAQGLQVQS